MDNIDTKNTPKNSFSPNLQFLSTVNGGNHEYDTYGPGVKFHDSRR